MERPEPTPRQRAASLAWELIIARNANLSDKPQYAKACRELVDAIIDAAKAEVRADIEADYEAKMERLVERLVGAKAIPPALAPSKHRRGKAPLAAEVEHGHSEVQ